MSISYYGLPVRDAALVGPMVEGTNKTHSIDIPEARAAVQRTISDGSGGNLRWGSGEDHILVDVRSSHVEVRHSAGLSDPGISVVMEILDTLRRTGLHVYDPQQRSWFFNT